MRVDRGRGVGALGGHSCNQEAQKVHLLAKGCHFWFFCGFCYLFLVFCGY
jgi:hypothetical protein